MICKKGDLKYLIKIYIYIDQDQPVQSAVDTFFSANLLQGQFYL